jgi:predicted secreted hydrolase
VSVEGIAWTDHQWGDFLVLGEGGWDWFAANLADGRDLTISLIRDASGATIVAYGTLVEASGEARHLGMGSFTVEALGEWVSPRTGIHYPSGWRVRVPAADLDLRWTPLLLDQELDARTSSGVIYWEGAVALHYTGSGADAGRGYVELTGYGTPR